MLTIFPRNRNKRNNHFPQGLFHSVAALSGPVIASYLHWDKRPSLYGRRMARELGCGDPEEEGAERVVKDISNRAFVQVGLFVICSHLNVRVVTDWLSEKDTRRHLSRAGKLTARVSIFSKDKNQKI